MRYTTEPGVCIRFVIGKYVSELPGYLRQLSPLSLALLFGREDLTGSSLSLYINYPPY
jgi:hypothetical protein